MNSTPQPECLTYLDADCDEQLCARTQLDYSCMSAMTASAQLIKYACEHLGLASMVCLNQMHYTPRKESFSEAPDNNRGTHSSRTDQSHVWYA